MPHPSAVDPGDRRYERSPSRPKALSQRWGLRQRARGAGLHLGISAVVALLAAGLVFGLWYPGPFRALAGGRDLFFLVMAVDVVLGPLLTFVVFDRAKGWKKLRMDLAVIGLVQVAGLGYGLHTVYAVRPVAMVFEIDRFRLITASDVNLSELPLAPEAYRDLPLTGPRLLGTRAPRTPAEQTDALFMGLRGVDIGQRPIYWQPYEKSAPGALARSKPIDALLRRFPKQASDLQERMADMKAEEHSSRFIPVTARGDWVAVLDQAGKVLGYLPVDGFN